MEGRHRISEGPSSVKERSKHKRRDIELLAAASVECVTVRQIATLGIIAWGRRPSPAKIEDCAAGLAAEIAAMDPDKKGLFVAKKAGEVVGFARVAQDKSGDPLRWWLLGLTVHPDYRRQGIGTALVDACIGYARERGAAEIHSETHSDNEVSIRFHKSVGFTVDGTCTAPDGDQKVAFRPVLTRRTTGGR